MGGVLLYLDDLDEAGRMRGRTDEGEKEQASIYKGRRVRSRLYRFSIGWKVIK